MNPEHIEVLKKKSKEELIEIIVKMDDKVFQLVKELGLKYEGIILDKSLNDFFAQKYEDGQ